MINSRHGLAQVDQLFIVHKHLQDYLAWLLARGYKVKSKQLSTGPNRLHVSQLV